jgi:hypothetical protein
MAWLINEDEAIKQLLSGLTVSDQNVAERPVKVWFRMPEAEEREVTYPFITIDLIDISEEEAFAHRGRIKPGYVPQGYNPSPIGSDYKTEFPVPITLTYQISTFTRSAWHDRQLTLKMHNVLPFRFGSLYVEADNTVRTLQLLDVQPFDGMDANNKRVFRKAYTVTVYSEIFPDALLAIQRVEQVRVDVHGSLEPLTIAQPLDASTGTP